MLADLLQAVPGVQQVHPEEAVPPPHQAPRGHGHCGQDRGPRHLQGGRGSGGGRGGGGGRGYQTERGTVS